MKIVFTGQRIFDKDQLAWLRICKNCNQPRLYHSKYCVYSFTIFESAEPTFLGVRYSNVILSQHSIIYLNKWNNKYSPEIDYSKSHFVTDIFDLQVDIHRHIDKVRGYDPNR